MIVSRKTVICDAKECSSCVFVESSSSINDITAENKAWDEKWRRINGRHYCPTCAVKMAQTLHNLGMRIGPAGQIEQM